MLSWFREMQSMEAVMMILKDVAPYLCTIASGVVLAATNAELSRFRRERETDKAEAEMKNKALADGVQSLLRQSIVADYNKYSDRGYCPIYAKESIKRAYKAYHTLGGNDVATELYRKILAMPEEPPEGINI